MKQVLAIFLFSLLSASVSAQSSEAYFNQPAMQRNGAAPTASEVILMQSGQLNQIQFQDSGAGNKVSLQQQGINNVLELDIAGNDNRYSFAQQGNNNLAQWRSRQNNAQLDVLQRGDNNRLTQDGSSLPGGVPMRIEQTGGMQLIIKNNY